MVTVPISTWYWRSRVEESCGSDPRNRRNTVARGRTVLRRSDLSVFTDAYIEMKIREKAYDFPK